MAVGAAHERLPQPDAVPLGRDRPPPRPLSAQRQRLSAVDVGQCRPRLDLPQRPDARQRPLPALDRSARRASRVKRDGTGQIGGGGEADAKLGLGAGLATLMMT